MKKILALVMALCLIFCLAACGSSEQTPAADNSSQPTQNNSSVVEDTKPQFTVTVVDQNGDPVPNVMIQICKDTCLPKATDANGVAKFDFESTDGHKLSMFSCPDGYETEYVGDNYIYLEDGETEYTFEITKK